MNFIYLYFAIIYFNGIYLYVLYLIFCDSNRDGQKAFLIDINRVLYLQIFEGLFEW